VPAHPSASIPSALTQFAHADPLQPDDAPHPLAYLATVCDPRARTGRRHPLVAILAMAAAAVLTGARSMTRSPRGPRTPSQSVPRSAPVVMPPTAGRCRPRPRSAGPSPASTRPRWPLWSACGSPTVTVPAASTGGRGRRQDALGRQLRRSAGPSARRHGPHHPRRARPTPGQRRPRRGPRIRPAAGRPGPCPDGGYGRRVHTHCDAAEFLVTSKQAHYLFTVKANQPGLLGRCERLAWHNVPVLDCTRDRAHGRVELRTLEAVSVRRFGSRTPHRSSRSPARPGTCAVGGGGR
jgi:hypothetical protein